MIEYVEIDMSSISFDPAQDVQRLFLVEKIQQVIQSQHNAMHLLFVDLVAWCEGLFAKPYGSW
jgi:hypothetical protein